MNNMDRFHITVGLIFSQLYDRFPYKNDLNLNCFIDILPLEKNEDCMPWNDMFHATMNWLKTENYILIQSESKNDEYSKIELTIKGLFSLSTITDTNGTKTTGESLVEAKLARNIEKLKQHGRSVILSSIRASA